MIPSLVARNGSWEESFDGSHVAGSAGGSPQHHTVVTREASDSSAPAVRGRIGAGCVGRFVVMICTSRLFVELTVRCAACCCAALALSWFIAAIVPIDSPAERRTSACLWLLNRTRQRMRRVRWRPRLLRGAVRVGWTIHWRRRRSA
eukprot:123387-Prymnesium_polylepis.1